jgi:hypothetical protein
LIAIPGLFLLLNPEGRAGDETVSFKKDVFPLVQTYCLPCHAEENFNPSELSMDNYKLIMAGGKSGDSVVKGKSAESLLIRKLGPKPPDGERMPLNPKKKVKEGKAVWMKDDEVKVIAKWIDQGAKDN